MLVVADRSSHVHDVHPAAVAPIQPLLLDDADGAKDRAAKRHSVPLVLPTHVGHAHERQGRMPGRPPGERVRSPVDREDRCPVAPVVPERPAIASGVKRRACARLGKRERAPLFEMVHVFSFRRLVVAGLVRLPCSP